MMAGHLAPSDPPRGRHLAEGAPGRLLRERRQIAVPVGGRLSLSTEGKRARGPGHSSAFHITKRDPTLFEQGHPVLHVSPGEVGLSRPLNPAARPGLENLCERGP